MGIPTLISTATASDAANVSITSGIDSTYDEYMFVFTDLNPVTSGGIAFQVNAVDQSGYNETITSSYFEANHPESDAFSELQYVASQDQAQGTSFQTLCQSIGTGSDQNAAGILHLFSPASTTYVKHWYSRFQIHYGDIGNSSTTFAAGYINTTAAIDDIQFKMANGGNMDGVIQMYGIA
tara:strand:+ start:22 stop:561 length:540 start_codon:yes stop_codon:yes gene_type:complete